MINGVRPEPLHVYVSPDQGTWLKVTWVWKGLSWVAYSIDRDLIQRVSKEVRQELRLLVQHALKNGEEGCKGSGGILKKIAISGYKLYNALFLGSKGQGDPERIRKWLLKQTEKIRITFFVDDRVHIPWGLIYDSDPSELSGNPEDIDPGSYPSFWCVKYWLSSVYSRIDPGILSGPKSSDKFRVLPILNKPAFDEALQALTTTEQEVIKNTLSTLDRPVYNAGDMFTRCNELRSFDCLLYFYCHANGTNLALGTTEEITIDDLRLRLKRNDLSPGESICMVFLNGCSTAVGDPGGGFLEATGGTGLCGFIGTETEVPDVFALRFGYAFLHEFLHTGCPVMQVMDILRTRHWPLSLAYGSYCFPEFQLTPKVVAAGTGLPGDTNFCMLSVGTKGMAL